MHGRGVHGGGGLHGRGACVARWRHVWHDGGMCGKTGACVARQGHVWPDGGHVWQGGMYGRGACVAGRSARQKRWPLQRTVRILLECILVDIIMKTNTAVFVFILNRIVG